MLRLRSRSSHDPPALGLLHPDAAFRAAVPRRSGETRQSSPRRSAGARLHRIDDASTPVLEREESRAESTARHVVQRDGLYAFQGDVRPQSDQPAAPADARGEGSSANGTSLPDRHLPIAGQLQLPALGGGAIVSNVGTWMQRVAQDWLVLTQLTHNNASAVGVVMALQFGPQMLMLPFSGFAADFFDRRKLLMATQAAMGLCALGLGLLTVTGLVQLWHVYVFAFLHGCAAAFDAPARQTFVSDLVGESRPAERGGAQLHLVQRRAHGRSRPRGPADRRRGNGLGLPGERLVVRRRALLAHVPARRRSPSAIAGPFALRAASSRASATSGTAPTSGRSFSCCS